VLFRSKGAGKFLSVNKNQFGNPIGFTLQQDLPIIFDELSGNMDNEVLEASIENIIKIRAVQEFSPAEATGFINLIKNIVISEAQVMMTEKSFIDSYFTFEKNIDTANGIAFEKYLEMKLKLSEIKINEIRNRNQRMVDRLTKKYSLEL